MDITKCKEGYSCLIICLLTVSVFGVFKQHYNKELQNTFRLLHVVYFDRDYA